MRTFEEISFDLGINPLYSELSESDFYKAVCDEVKKEAVDEVTASLSELIRSLQRINNKTPSGIDHEYWVRLHNAQAVLAKYADHSSPRIVQSKTEQ